MDEETERKHLLGKAFTDEALRRMARRARVTSVAQTGDLVVNAEIRLVADLILRNLCKTITAFLDYRGPPGRVDLVILRQALEHLQFKANQYSEPGDAPFPACQTLRQKESRASRAKSSGRPKPKASRGGLAAKEIEHENRDSRDDCVYMETAPFLRLLKFEIDQY